jgi:hypothetical protein
MSQKIASTQTPRSKGKASPRKHGYRGYGSGAGRNADSFGGKIHWGRGFTGLEFPDGGGETLLESGLLTPELKERVSKKS